LVRLLALTAAVVSLALTPLTAYAGNGWVGGGSANKAASAADMSTNYTSHYSVAYQAIVHSSAKTYSQQVAVGKKAINAYVNGNPKGKGGGTGSKASTYTPPAAGYLACNLPGPRTNSCVPATQFHCGGQVPLAWYNANCLKKKTVTYTSYNRVVTGTTTTNGVTMTTTYTGAHSAYTGFEVYRFYQQTGSATPLVTRSRLNLPQWSYSATPPPIDLANSTTWDATPAKAPGLPDYKTAGTVKLVDGQSASSPGVPTAVGKRESGKLTAGQPVAGSKSKGTTALCTTVSKENPLIKNFPLMSAPEKVMTRALLGKMYLDNLYTDSTHKTQQPRNAFAAAGMTSLKGYPYSIMPNQNLYPGKAPTRDSRGANYYATTFVYDTRACNSLWNLVKSETKTPAGVVTPINPGVAYGTAAVWLARPYNTYKVTTATKTTTSYSTLTTTHYSNGTSTSYYSSLPSVTKYTNYTTATKLVWPTAAQGGVEHYVAGASIVGSTPASSKSITSWKAAMNLDYSRRPRPAGTQAKPVQQKANDLTRMAAYRIADLGLVSIGKQDPTPPGPKPVVTLTMSTPAVLQSGGAAYQATYTVNEPTLTCDGKPCVREHLTGVSYTLNAVGVGLYTECQDGQLTGCDFRVIKPALPLHGKLGTPGSLTVEFYNGTNPGQFFNVTVKSPTVTYSYTDKTTQITIDGVSRVTGRPVHYRTGVVTTTKNVTVTPKLTASPVPASFSGGVYTVKMPVISAVNIP